MAGPLEHGHWAPVAGYLEREIGFSLPPERWYLIDAACAPLAKEFASSPEQLAGLAARDPRLRQRLINAATINESYFFRDTGLWKDLGERILPELAAEVKYRGRVQVLVCACSRGQEVWTIAMTAQMQAQRIGMPVEILATDIDTEVLAYARAGRYNSIEVSRGLNEALLDRFFIRDGDGWCVRDSLRVGVRFEQVNLAAPFTVATRHDLVFCRNVLIYFSLVLRKAIVERLANATAPYGYLLLGGAETLLGVSDLWQPRRLGASTVYQRGYPART